MLHLRADHAYKLVDIIWICLLAIYVQGGMYIIPLQGDEPILTFMGRDFYHHFVEQDLSLLRYDESIFIKESRWSNPYVEQELRLLNGTIPKYIYGWTAYILGYKINEINRPWGWGYSYERNLKEGRITDDVLLTATRYTAAIQFVLAIGVFFVVCRNAFNRPVAYLATFYLTMNPTILLDARRAVSEGSHLLFMMLVLLIALWLIRDRRRVQFILFGLVAGFAVAAKHPNAIVVMLLFISCGSYWILTFLNKKLNRTELLKLITGLVFSGIISLGTFYALNPAWWEAPLQSANKMIDLRTELVELQTYAFTDSHATHLSISDRTNSFFRFVFVAEVLDNLHNQYDVAERYHQSIWDGIPIGGSSVGGYIVMALTIFGFIHMWRNPNILPEYRWLITIWGVGICLFNFVSIPFQWARYYIPSIPVIGMILAYSLVVVSQKLWLNLMSQKSIPEP